MVKRVVGEIWEDEWYKPVHQDLNKSRVPKAVRVRFGACEQTHACRDKMAIESDEGYGDSKSHKQGG